MVDAWLGSHLNARNTITKIFKVSVCVGGGGKAYSRLSTTHGHITDCKLDSVVYAGVCVVI